MIEYNAYLKKSYIYFTIKIGIPLLSPMTSLSPLQISNVYNFLISGQKHKLWV